jgi:putative DNA-invertase from lambdoid prophage Rac
MVERTNSGLARAKAEGATLGRPATPAPQQQEAVRAALAAGSSVSEVARQYDTSRQTIMRVRDAVIRAE